MSCSECANWVVERQRLYGDGTRQTYYKAPEGKGRCTILPLDTDPGFHCSMFSPGSEHVKIDNVEGAPWEHWDMGPCPECRGRGCPEGGGACMRCVGTGKVRFYADGFVGEERTRRHPKEPLEPLPTPPAAYVPPPRPDVLGGPM